MKKFRVREEFIIIEEIESKTDLSVDFRRRNVWKCDNSERKSYEDSKNEEDKQFHTNP